MQAPQLVELAAVAAAHGAVLVRTTATISPTSLDQYWIASKCRLDRWFIALAKFREALQAPDLRSRKQASRQLGPLLEEVFTGDVLARVWAAVSVAYDQHHRAEAAEPIARSVWLGQIEASNRAMSFLLTGTAAAIDPPRATAFNRLRRRCERWTDMLVGYLLDTADVSSLAPHPDRAKEFGHDLRHEIATGNSAAAWPLTLAALRAAFAKPRFGDSPNADLNGDIAAAVLACFPADLFDQTGLIPSLWLVRLANAAEDTAGMIDQLIDSEDSGIDPDQARQILRRLSR